MNRPFDRIPRWLRLTPIQWSIVIGAAVIAALIGFSLQSQQQDTYGATAKVLFRNAGLDQALFGSSVLTSSGTPDRDAATNVKLILSDTVAERVAKIAGLPASAASELMARASVGSSGDSNIALITFTDPNPERAAGLANAWAEQFVQARVEADRSKIQQALDYANNRVEQLKSSGASNEELIQLQKRLDDLSLLSAVQTGNVEIVDRAAPSSSPEQSSAKQVALGIGMLQFLLGLGLMAGYRRLRDPVDGPDDLEALRLPVLAELPRVRRIVVARGAPEVEAFDSGIRLLRGNLSFVASPGATVISIQSTRPDEGKSTVAFHLARVAARSGSRVCLIDADLRFRSVTRGVGEQHQKGLSSLLASLSTARPDDVTSAVKAAVIQVEGFHMLCAGPQPPNPGDLAVREVVPLIIDSIRTGFDLVIIDAPPFLGLPDASRFLQASDGVVIVVRRRFARLFEVQRLVDRLKVLGASPVGSVLNMAAPRDENLTYGYLDGDGRAATSSDDGLAAGIRRRVSGRRLRTPTGR